MYKHILVATDGSKLSRKAIQTGVGLASAVGARISGVYVIPPYVPVGYSEGMIYAPAITGDAYRRALKREGRKALAVLEIEARTAGVEYAEAMLSAPSAWEGILRTARAKKCDLIVMSSHGRRGLAGLVLGSETQKVLTHSSTPVLVCR